MITRRYWILLDQYGTPRVRLRIAILLIEVVATRYALAECVRVDCHLRRRFAARCISAVPR